MGLEIGGTCTPSRFRSKACFRGCGLVQLAEA